MRILLKQNVSKIILIAFIISMIGIGVYAQTPKKIKILNKEYTEEQYEDLKIQTTANFINVFTLKKRQMTPNELVEWIEVAKKEIRPCKFKNITLSKENLITNLSRFNNVILLGCEK